MVQLRNIIPPYSKGYVSEREFYVNILLDGVPLPAEEIQQLRKLELDLHESKGTVGKIEIGTTVPNDSVWSTTHKHKSWGQQTVNHKIWKPGRKLTLFLGPRGDVFAFYNLSIREPRYKFTLEGAIVEVEFRDAMSRMKRKTRQRRFRNINAGQLIQKIAKRHGLTPVVEANGATSITFDDDNSFSQVREHDAALIEKLCRRYGWQWRIDGDKMVVYDPLQDASARPVDAYRLDFRVGECTVEKFIPKIKRVVVKQKIKDPTRAIVTSEVQGKKIQTVVTNAALRKARLEQKVKKRPKVPTTSAVGAGTTDPDTQIAQQTSQAAYDQLVYGRNPPTRDADSLEGEDGYVGGSGDDSLDEPDDESPDEGGVGIEPLEDNYKVSREWINAEVVLAVPTMRLQPRTSIDFHCGNSSFFSKGYKTKAMRLVLDGRTGKPTVSLQIKRMAWARYVNLSAIARQRNLDKVNAELVAEALAIRAELKAQGELFRSREFYEVAIRNPPVATGDSNTLAGSQPPASTATKPVDVPPSMYRPQNVLEALGNELGEDPDEAPVEELDLPEPTLGD